MAYDSVFGMLEPSKDEREARQARDKHCYIAGKEAASMKLSGKDDVQYDDARDKRMFNMGWISGEL